MDAKEEEIINANTCDISLLTISTNPQQDASENCMQDELDNNDDLELKLYLNKVKADCDAEEATIAELIRSTGDGKLLATGHSNSARVAFGVILRLVLPLKNGVARGIRGIRSGEFLKVLKNITSSRQAMMNLVSFTINMISMNLSSVQVSQHIDPLLKLMKIQKKLSLPEAATATPETASILSEESPSVVGRPIQYFPAMPQRQPFQTMAKCCTLNVLAEPPAEIRADIVLIHGLHGSLANTWKQGLWVNERQPLEFKRPPKPPVRPPKRPKHSRTAVKHPSLKQKRARFTQPERCAECHSKEDCPEAEDMFDSAYTSDESKEAINSDDMDDGLSRLRLRVNDKGTFYRSHNAQVQENYDNSNENQHENALPKSAKDPNYSFCWPSDWLPLDCPGVRVIALNYTTDQYLWRPLWKQKEQRSSLKQRAREMEELLIKNKVGYGHPIIWVAHSKGGLFAKQIIVDAWESGIPAMSPLWRSTRGIFFYSVPHRGSHLASIKAPFLTRSVELIDIEKNSKYLLDLHRRFLGLYHLGHLRIEVFSFIEMALTLMSVLYLRIVGVDSADPGIGDVCGIRLDHREICKPRSRNCILYTELVKMIKKVY